MFTGRWIEEVRQERGDDVILALVSIMLVYRSSDNVTAKLINIMLIFLTF
jgi:hypothetical protein